MQFKLGTKVFTSDEHQVGAVDHVVIAPGTNDVTHIVIRKGLLFGKDKVIPIGEVQSAEANRILLKQSAHDPDQYPDFEEKIQVPSEADAMPRNSGSSLDFGAGSVADPGPRYVTTTLRNIPDDTVPLKAGTRIISSDDRHVGDVERVLTGPESPNHATQVVMSQGLLTKTLRALPVEWVSHVLEGELHLTVDSHFLSSLPEFREEVESV